jgi:hypothetical protein
MGLKHERLKRKRDRRLIPFQKRLKHERLKRKRDRRLIPFQKGLKHERLKRTRGSGEPVSLT